MILLIYTLIQIITESLPISSSTHAQLVGTTSNNQAYDYFLHGFTLLVIAIYFFSEWWFLIKKPQRSYRMLIRLCVTAVISDIFTAIFYCVLPYTPLPMIRPTFGILLTAFLLLCTHPAIVRRVTQYSQRKFSWPIRATIVGVIQGCALLPGISRMGSTYALARFMGLRPYRALALSLLIQVPLIGAGFLKGVYILQSTHELAQYMSTQWIAVYLCATVAAYGMLCITLLLAKKERLWFFGIYLLILGFFVR